jgi:hypothetical protein
MQLLRNINKTTLLPSVSSLLHLGKDARKYLFQFLLYCPVCSYFIALFVFLPYVPTFETSCSNFNENKSAKDYTP